MEAGYITGGNTWMYRLDKGGWELESRRKSNASKIPALARESAQNLRGGGDPP